MAIEKGDDSEQLQLIEVSREEMLEQLCQVETEILKLTINEKRHKDAANAVKNEIKTKVSDKTTLLNRINSQGKTTFVPFAVDSSDNGEDEAAPTDEDLSEFSDEEEVDENPPVSAGEVIEGLELHTESTSNEDQTDQDALPEDFDLGPEFEEQRKRELEEAESAPDELIDSQFEERHAND